MSNRVWFVVYNDNDAYMPQIFAFKTREGAVKRFISIIENDIGEKTSEEDKEIMLYEYQNGIIYVDSLDVET